MSCFALLDGEGSKPTDLHPIAGYHGIRDAVYDEAYDSFASFVVKVRVLRRDADNEVGSDHEVWKHAEVFSSRER